MKGTDLKYRRYKGQGTGFISIPKVIAEAMKWSEGMVLVGSIEVMNGKKGLFIASKEN